MPDDMQKPDRADEKSDQKPATFTGESRGSSPNTATGFGRGGDVIVQDDVVYGRPLSGRDRAEGDRAPDQQVDDADRPNQSTDESAERDR